MIRFINCAFVLFLFSHLSYSQGPPVKSIMAQYRDEIKTITQSRKIQSAFKFIKVDDDRTVSEHILLTEIPAPPFKEMKRAAKFKSMLEEIGVDSAWIDRVGNVIALRKGSNGRKTVVLDAHLDTVFPEEIDVTVKHRGDTLFAPGISDDTRGLAMVLAVARALNEADIKTKSDVLLIGSVGEEGLGDLRGVKELFSENGPGIDSWISIDGGAIGRVNNKGLGSYRYRVTYEGPGGHSWGAFGLANPHHALGTAIDYFVEGADQFTSYGPRTSYNVGRIGGGTSINSIPFTSWMEIDMRSVSPTRLDTLESILKSAVDKALDEQNKIARRGYPLTVKFEKIGDRPSGELSEELPLIQRAMATTAYFGKRPELTRGSTNSNTPISMGIPAVTIGRGGRGQNAHSLNEWWLNEDGYKATQLALLLLVAESGMD
ncbi:MAG: M20/M25/M40 family metallo-hydrolase [Saprospiraceae bacterium]|nr:M20/M25/M40 family metallo-hydrolase [Saprospiraceae bacterium]